MTGDWLLPASIDKVKRYREPALPERDAVGNTPENSPQNLDRDADCLDAIISKITRLASGHVFGPSPSHMMKELHGIYGHKNSSFSSLDAIGADDFVVKNVKPDDPRG